MKYKKLPFLTFLIFLCLLFVGKVEVLSQSASSERIFEDVSSRWFTANDKLQAVFKISNDELGLFNRFSEKEIDSLRGDFMRKIGKGIVTSANVNDYENILLHNLTTLYDKFESIKERYPSSVEEYRHDRILAAQTCDSACDNIDFETGDLSGWYAYYGLNNSSTTANSIIGITGGLAGAVTHAANDVYTSTQYNPSVPPIPGPDYQINITSGNRGDAIVPTIPVVSPFGGHYSVMLGDSTQINYGAAMLSQTFLVGKSNANFTYQYAVFLANPNHQYYQQPFFRIALLDQNGDTIPYCGEYNVVSGNGTQKFNRIVYNDTLLRDTFSVYYKNWTIVNVPLVHYIGQCVTVVFEIADCSLGGHFGYAYIDASCAPMNIISSSQNFCGQDSINLTGPSGEGKYSWTGPAGGIRSSDTLQQVSVDSAGTYTLVVTPFTGATCNDTLTISIGKKPGPVPHPNFVADTGCIGSSTTFLNSSNPTAGASFYWDFYNTGTYEDSDVSPTWKYNLPGVYTVRLHEVHNGCGADTTLNVVIDSVFESSFKYNIACFGDSTEFINTSKPYINTSTEFTYYWNFGDTASGVANNTSQKVNPSHLFSAPGTYVVSLLGKHPGWCTDTDKSNVVVTPLPVGNICCNDTVFAGSSVILTASGGGLYYWTPPVSLDCDTCAKTIASPTVTTVYTLLVTNAQGCSSHAYTTVDVEIPCQDFFVPNVFSPNGDGVNDTYLIKVKYTSAYQISIYNRWGKRVFHSTNPDNPWDGNINGSPASAGIYYYILNVTCLVGNSVQKHGFLELIR